MAATNLMCPRLHATKLARTAAVIEVFSRLTAHTTYLACMCSRAAQTRALK